MVTVRKVRKQFATVAAVDSVSLEVRRGEVFALLGPNGAGKTTLLRMLLGLIHPDSGSIDFPGHAAGRPDPGEVGYLPEDRGLYLDVNVLDTLSYFGTSRKSSSSALFCTVPRSLYLTNRSRVWIP